MDLREPFSAEVAPDVHRVGTGIAAFYLLHEGGRYTLVDGAFPKYFKYLTAFMEERQLGFDAIDAPSTSTRGTSDLRSPRRDSTKTVSKRSIR